LVISGDLIGRAAFSSLHPENTRNCTASVAFFLLQPRRPWIKSNLTTPPRTNNLRPPIPDP
jgi:hypothetical protein